MAEKKPQRKPPLASLSRHSSDGNGLSNHDSKTRVKWRTLLALLLIYIAVIFNLQWVWGVLFLIWVLPDIYSGITFFVEPIVKNENPVLFWLIIVSWILMSAYSISTLFVDYSQYPGWS